MPDQDRRAIHEAGHAVVGFILGRTIKEIRVPPSGSAIGGVAVLPWPDRIHYFRETGVASTAVFLADYLTACAGPVAEAKFTEGPVAANSDDGDRQAMEAALLSLTERLDVTGEQLRLVLESVAKKLVDECWRAIGAVQKTLLTQADHTLRGEHALKAVRDATKRLGLGSKLTTVLYPLYCAPERRPLRKAEARDGGDQ